MNVIDDPLHLIAEYRHPEFVRDGIDLAAMKEQYDVALRNCAITIHFGTANMRLLAAESEAYATVCQARKEAIEAMCSAKEVLQAETLEDFHSAAEKFHNEYDTLISSVQHFVFIWPEKKYRPLSNLVRGQM